MQKKYFLLKQFIFVLSISLLLISCSNSNNKEKQQNDNNQQIDRDKSENTVKSNVYTSYNLPLPIEIYKFLKNNNIEFNLQLLNSKDKQANTFTDISKAINLGFYSSDLAYCTIFDQSQESVDYFSISIELAHELDITEGYDEKVLDRTYDNIENNDSLSNIAEEAYWKTCNYLEKNKKINILPFIIVGSWLESMHILTESSKNITDKKLIYAEIYNQKESLKNLIFYLFEVMNDSNAFIVNDDIQAVIKSLKLIQAEFEKINNQ
ncbi:MAG: hypothetical protein JXA16_08010, partial [Bacteroidales bacterium]|nr:hypothetical protein [Bacteroidales bacterium]